jgi:hypothetical protein
MAAKIVSVSADDVTYYTLPGNQGDLQRQSHALEDTIFGQTFKSMSPGLITWQVASNAFYKGFPGYVCTLKKSGTSTAMTAEGTTLISGGYRINTAGRRLLDRSVQVNVFDGGVNKNAFVDSVDFLNGIIYFLSTYTVTGAVTVTGNYLPLVTLGKFTSFTLTQSTSVIKDTNIPDAQTNGGYDTFRVGGIRDVQIQLPTIFAAADAWDTALTTRGEYVIELNPDGISSSVARGFFKLFDDKQSGNVGALEDENLQFNLFVPLSTGTQLAVKSPFVWTHATGGPIPNALKLLLDAWLYETPVYVKYLYDGSNGWKGTAIVSNVSMTGGLEAVTQFSAQLQGSGARTVVGTGSTGTSGSVAASQPRFANATGIATGDNTSLATLFASMTNLTSSSIYNGASGGRSGTFNTTASSTLFAWIAVLKAAVGATPVRFFDGTGYGGFSGANAGAGSTALYAGTEVDPTLQHLEWTDGSGNVWNFYRSDSHAVTFSSFTLS